MYYNPETKEQISLISLKKKYNASIPNNREEYKGWYLIHNAELPPLTDTQYITNGSIELIDGKYVRTYVVNEKDSSVIELEKLNKAKKERADAISKITVDIDGMVFDGDEISQERMSRTITAATATGENETSTTTWVLHDNTVATPTIAQLARALRAAGEEQTRLWTIPYEEE